MSIAYVSEALRRRARHCREAAFDERVARVWEAAADVVEAALHDASHEALTANEAAEEIGCHAESIRRAIREGRVPNAGTAGPARDRQMYRRCQRSPERRSGDEPSNKEVVIMPRKRRIKVLATKGEYGNRVSVIERVAGGALSLRYWDPSACEGRGGYRYRSRKHNDLRLAKLEAKKLSEEIEAGGDGGVQGPLTVTALFARYQREEKDHKKECQRQDDLRRMDVWQAFLGPARDVKTIDLPSVKRFTRLRSMGKLRVPDRKLRAASDTTIGHEIQFLKGVLNWATTWTLSNGQPLLAHNPIAGARRLRNKNPKRPVTSYDRYLKLQEHTDEVDPQKLLKPLLQLVESLGWRTSALCQLRASDIDCTAGEYTPHGRILKRAETDKTGVEVWTPLSSGAREAVDLAFTRNPVVGDAWLFPAAKRKGTSWDRHHARTLLRRAEEKAGIPKQNGGAFHPYRRKWRRERNQHSRANVAAAGAWQSVATLDIYDGPDEEALLAVMEEPRKLREVKREAR